MKVTTVRQLIKRVEQESKVNHAYHQVYMKQPRLKWEDCLQWGCVRDRMLTEDANAQLAADKLKKGGAR